jgi:hypothetical protein
MPAIAAEPVDDFSYRYQIIRNGSALGSTRTQFKALPNGVWQYSSQASGTEGLAGIAGAGVDERSTLIAPRGQLELFSNRTETRVAWKTEVKSISFDKAGNAYIYQDRKGSQRIAYKPGMLDQHSLTLALIADLRAGNGKSFTYSALSKGKLETLRFKVTGEAVIDTALGKLNTVRVDRIRDSANGKTTRIWFAKDRGFAPVLIQELDSNGDDIEMRIQALQ